MFTDREQYLQCLSLITKTNVLVSFPTNTPGICLKGGIQISRDVTITNVKQSLEQQPLVRRFKVSLLSPKGHLSYSQQWPLYNQTQTTKTRKTDKYNNKYKRSYHIKADGSKGKWVLLALHHKRKCLRPDRSNISSKDRGWLTSSKLEPCTDELGHSWWCLQLLHTFTKLCKTLFVSELICTNRIKIMQ